MNQSELVDKVAQRTTLTQAAAAGAVKAVVQAIFESLVAGEPVRVAGLGTFNVAARPARSSRNDKSLCGNSDDTKTPLGRITYFRLYIMC